MGIEILLAIAGLVWFILNIILFFKLWGACDDIRRIADKYDPEGKAQRDAAAKKASEEAYKAMLEDN